MVTKFFKEFAGNKTAFKNGGYETTLANNIVFIKDEANNGAGACIFARGMYFGNFAELIAALAFVKGINVGGTNYNAANGGGYVKFEAADPATVVYVENNGIKIGLSAAFVEAHDAVIADVAAIKADYLKGADKEALQKSINDKDAAMKQYVDAEIAKVATSEAFNALTGRVSTLEGEIVTERGRIDGIINTTIPAIQQSVTDAQNASKVTFESTIGEGNNPNVYTFKQGGEQIGQISIAKDLVVKSGAIVELDGVKNLQLTLTNGDVVSVPVNELVDVYTAGDYITIGSDNKISVNKAELLAGLATDENLGKLEVRVKANEDAVATVDSRIEAAEGRAKSHAETKVSEAEGRINETIEGIEGDIEGLQGAVATKAEQSYVTEQLGLKANAATTYSKTDVDGLLSGKANVGVSYTKEEANNLLSGKADKTSVYTKNETDSKIATELEPYAKTTEVEGLVAPKADKTYVDEELAKLAKTGDSYLKSETYTKEEVNGLVSPKADKDYVDTELGKKADASTTYSKTEVDGLVAPKANAADVYTKTEVDNMFAWERIEA